MLQCIQLSSGVAFGSVKMMNNNDNKKGKLYDMIQILVGRRLWNQETWSGDDSIWA